MFKDLVEKRNFYVAIAGNIGSGKSSLTTLLAKNFGWKAFYEIVETNPYLTDFYEDMRQWSFHTQVFFLTKRFDSLRQLDKLNEPVVQDRSVYEDCEIFAKNLFLSGMMSERDYKTYHEHFQSIAEFFRAPDMLIYLKCDVPTLMQRIKGRNREYERRISEDYLKRLNICYEEWIESYNFGPVTSIDVSGKDFVNRAEDLRQILAIVKWEIECLQNDKQTALPLKSRLSGKESSIQVDL